ncbi:MAG: hypothetical protein NVSMB40_13880 [Aquirhabdus sp.]
MSEKLIQNCERIAIALCVINGLALLSAFVLPTIDLGVLGVAAFALTSVTLCIVHAAATKGWKKALVFTAISFAISWFVEFIGCNYGWWFGDYSYTKVLGFAVGNVPLLVVCSWEALIYPSLLLVDSVMGKQRSNPTKGQALARIAIASLATAWVTTVWDLMGDPLAVRLNWWNWHFGGAYMHELAGGVPFSNMWGWAGAVFIISVLYRWLYPTNLEISHAAQANATRSPLLFAVSLYTAWFCSAAYSLIHNGLFEPLFIGVYSMGMVVIFCWARYFFHDVTGTKLTANPVIVN